MENKFSFDTGFCGWMTIRVGKYLVRASYLRSTPLELIEVAHSILSGNFETLEVDAEGTDFVILFTDKEIKVYDFIIGRDGFNDLAVLSKVKIRYYEVARIIYETIKNNIETIIRNFYIPTSEEHYIEIYNEMTDNLNSLKIILDIYSKRETEKFSLYFNYHHYRGWFYRTFIIIYHLVYERLFARNTK